MSETLDRRQEKTRAALHAAFRQLLLEQGYDGFTIADVATHANIGRSTFYEHYRTKDDLLRASVGKPLGLLADLVSATSTATSPSAALGGVLAHFRQYQQLARVLLGWRIRPVLSLALSDLVLQRLNAMPLTRPLIPLEAVARQIADAQLALLETWIAGRPAYGLDAASEALQRSTTGIVNALCGQAAAP